MTLRDKTVHAIKWSYFSLFAGIALNLVISAILSRLLSPAAFGVVALALVLQRFGLFISDLGVGQALVQKPELNSSDVRAAWTSSLGLGLLVTVLAWLTAPLAGELFHKPELVPVFRGYALTYVFMAAVVVSTSLLRRSLRFRPLVIAELSAFVLGHGIIGLGAAYLGYGAMSLAISAVAQIVVQMVIVYALAPHSLRFTFRRADYAHLYSFGTRLTLANFLEFISSSLDTFFLGRWFSAAALGLYSRTMNVVTGPTMSFAGSLTRVLSPSFASMQGDPPRLKRAYLSGTLALMLIMACTAGCMVVDAREIVLVMLGGGFLTGVPLMQVFALLVPFAVLSNLSGTLIDATAQLNAKIVVQAVYLVALALAFLGVRWAGGGVMAFAIVLVVATVARNLAFTLVARRIVGGGGRELLRIYAIGALWAVLSVLVSAAVVLPLRAMNTHLVPLFIVELLLGAGLVAAAVLWGPPNELQAMARRTLQGLSSRAGRWWSALASR